MRVENLEFHIKHTGDKGASGLKNLRDSLKGARKEAEKSQGTFGKLLSTFKRLTLLRVLRRIIQEIGKAFEEGLKNAYMFSKTVNGELSKTLNSIASLGMQMKNQIGAALGELLMNVRPIVEAIENLVIRIADAMSRLFAVLGGRSTYNKAVASTQEWASATESGAAAAKEWKKQLLGFDEINKLEAPGDSGSGSGKKADDIGKWEEAVAQMEWAKQLRDITISWFQSLNLEPIINAWERLKQAVSGFISLVNDALYWAYTKVLLPLAGWTIEKGLPVTLIAVAEAFELITTVLDKLSPLFNEFFEVIIKPFAKFIGDNFVKIMEDLAETFEGLREKVEQANTLGEFIQSLDGKEKVIVAIATAILAVSLAIATFNIVKGAIDAVTTAFKLLTSPVGLAIIAIAGLTLVAIDLYQKFDTVREKFDAVGEKFAEFKERFHEPEYWAELGTAIVEAISTAIGAAIGSILTTLKDIVDQLVTNIKTAIKENFSKDLNADGETTWDEIGANILIGILEGIVNAIKGIGKWIKEHVLKPFVDGFKEAFGIASPAEEMKPIGEYIWEGVLEGIVNKIKEIGEWIKTKVWEPFKEAVKSAFGIGSDDGAAENAKPFGEALAEGLKDGIAKIWAGLDSWFTSTIWAPLESLFSGLAANCQTWVSNIQSLWNSAKTMGDNLYNSNVDVEGLYSVYPGQYSQKASGGFVDDGELFLARESGAELVGSVGGRTAVMNNDQIVAAVSSGVASAVASVMRNGRSGNGGEVILNVNGKEFMRAIYNDMTSVQSEKGFSLVNA